MLWCITSRTFSTRAKSAVSNWAVEIALAPSTLLSCSNESLTDSSKANSAFNFNPKESGEYFNYKQQQYKCLTIVPGHNLSSIATQKCQRYSEIWYKPIYNTWFPQDHMNTWRFLMNDSRLIEECVFKQSNYMNASSNSLGVVYLPEDVPCLPCFHHGCHSCEETLEQCLQFGSTGQCQL